ncbi:MAG: redoxin domain-containing protein [Tannerella sp.]|jgi:peroxiredoxin|nr:redoxin domain-containing protein [Tannerella sp.]
MKLNVLTIILLAFVSISCKQELMKVVLPDNVSSETENYIQSHEYMIVLCLDASDCSPCLLNLWKPYKRVMEKRKTGILLVILNSDEETITNTLKNMNVTFNFIIDKESTFKTNNEVFKFAKDKAFVIDRNKNVVFPDSPIKNEKNWTKVLKIVSN